MSECLVRLISLIFSCYFCSSANVGYLELLVFVENDEDLGENLIREGYAVARPERLIPRESECFLVD